MALDDSECHAVDISPELSTSSNSCHQSSGTIATIGSMTDLTISAAHARRFLVSRHLLAPPRSLPAEPQSVLAAVERLGSLQFDPLEVPGARNHDLVLHSRVAGYQREWCERWLYGSDRSLIELYNKSLNIVPMHELPHYRVTWHRNLADIDNGILRDQAPVAKAILKRLKTDGPLSTAAFSEHGHAVDWWWAPTRASRAVMEALFVTGRIGIARREGNRRYYDLIERLVPRDVLKLKESEEDGMTRRLLSRFRATGMTTPVGTQAEVMYSAGSTAERVARTERLVADGELLPIEVEGLKGPRYIIAAEESILEATSRSLDHCRRLRSASWHRSIRSSGIGGCFVPCGTSTTCGRSTCRRRSGSGATTSCRCCSAIGSSAASSHASIARRRP